MVEENIKTKLEMIIMKKQNCKVQKTRKILTVVETKIMIVVFIEKRKIKSLTKKLWTIVEETISRGVTSQT